MASELAEIEGVSRPAISRILNALEGLGLVRRERSIEDRRRVQVHATAAGHELMEAGRRRRVTRIAAELEGLSAKDLATLDRATRALQKLDG